MSGGSSLPSDTFIEAMYTCAFCDEVEQRSCSLLSPPRNRFLYETPEFMVFPTLGCFVEGYLLICPKQHVSSIANLSTGSFTGLAQLASRVKEIVAAAYGEPIVFEHGMSGCGRIDAGGCIEHAHLHVVPGTIDIEKLLAEYSRPEEIPWSSVAQFAGTSYILGQSYGGKTWVSAVRDVLPSQYMRRLVARELGVFEFWDWRDYPEFDKIDATLARLSLPFQTLKACSIESNESIASSCARLLRVSLFKAAVGTVGE